MATLARASSTFAAEISRCACISSNSISDPTFLARRVCLFFRFTSASASCASACFRVAWASASESSLLFDANSNRRSPLFTTCPAVKLILLRSPSRRGATSASRAAVTIPLYSRISGAPCCWDGAWARDPLESAASVKVASNITTCVFAGMICVLLCDCIAARCFAEERRAQLGRPLQRLEVHIDQPEAIAVDINPFEVVLRAPEEVPIHRYTVGGRTLELREAGVQEHDPVGVVHLAIVSDHVRRGAAVFRDEDRLRAPQ